MNIRQGTKPAPSGRPRAAETEDAAAIDAYTPRKVTFAENVILTIKVFSVLGMVGAALWGMNLWTSPQ
jgi:hypothetical protein